MMAEESVFRQLIRASTVGIHLVVSTFVGLAIGYFLDRLFGTSPWLTVIFLFLGIVTGFRDLFRMARDARDEGQTDEKSVPYDDEDEDESGDDGPVL